ncbi:MAG: hypothetical protein IPM16_17040 [Chloroflexi bacterium]|nr:hypothetical protein [Chloroflexota bacterium]
MPAVRFPIRPWLYLAAAGLLAVPLAQYTDTPEQLAVVAFGTLLVTLAAHVEVLGAVRRSRLPQMRGQPDLLRLSMFRIGRAERDVWRGLWHSGRWTVVAALIFARFALALALAHYLYLFFLYVHNVPVIGDGLNALLRTVNYYGQNVYTYPPYPPSVVFLDAAVWQKALAVALIAALTLAEARFVMMLGLLLCTGPRWLQRHLAGAAGLIRIAIAGVGVVVALQLAFAPWLPYQWITAPSMICLDKQSVAEEIFRQSYSWYSQPCRGIALERVVMAGAEAVMLLGLTPLDGAILTATNVMRPQVGRDAADERDVLRMHHEFVYTSSAQPGRSARPYAVTGFSNSPVWLTVRMTLVVFSSLAALLMAVIVLRQVVRRRLYRTR